MNNDTKPANIMTWATFKNKFNPTAYYREDSVFGKVTVEPTMMGNGFKRMNIQDIDELYNYKPPKPLEIVKDQIDVYKYSYVVYYVWKHRDFHGTSIDIFYK